MFMYTQTCVWILLFWSVLLKILAVLLALHSSTEISKWGFSYLLNRCFTCSCLGVNSRRIFSVSIFLSLRSLFSGEYAQTLPTFKLSIGPKKNLLTSDCKLVIIVKMASRYFTVYLKFNLLSIFYYGIEDWKLSLSQDEGYLLVHQRCSIHSCCWKKSEKFFPSSLNLFVVEFDTQMAN